MKTEFAERRFSTPAQLSIRAANAALVFAVRACALSAFLLMSLAEPFMAVVLSSLAIGCFLVAVLFGFVFHVPFHHRWFVLGASVVFLMTYVLYRFLMQGIQRLLR